MNWGHFFGLPHGDHRDSLMNKDPDPTRLPWVDRYFVPAELRRMRGRARQLVADGVLVPKNATLPTRSP